MDILQYLFLAALLALTLWGLAFSLVAPLLPSGGTMGVFHTAAWGQSISSNGALTQINAVQDPVITTQAGDIRVPVKWFNLVMQAALNNDASAARAQITSPSLRAVANIDVEPIVPGKVFGSPIEPYWHGDSPIPLVPNESLNFFTQNAQAAAVLSYGLIWLSDGPQKPVTGQMYSVRATSAVTLAAATWVNGNLTFAQVLPAGRYSVVGFRARGTNLCAARLVFTDYINRPGVPACNTVGGLDFDNGRYGYMGEFGQFDNTNPPTVDCLGDTDSAQSYDLDIIKIK